MNVPQVDLNKLQSLEKIYLQRQTFSKDPKSGSKPKKTQNLAN